MILSINQPAFLPWLGYFNRIALSDIHIVLDHVQIETATKTSFTNRNKVRTAQGWTWITVPISFDEAPDGRLIKNVRIAKNTNLLRKMWPTIEQNYRRAPFFGHYVDRLRDELASPGELLAPLNERLTTYLLESFGTKTRLLFSSQMGITSTRSDLVLDLCRAANASTYISGPFGRDYLDRDKFAEAGIEIRFHDYRHPQYRQFHPGFEPFMSAIDLLFNLGPDSSAVVHERQELATS